MTYNIVKFLETLSSEQLATLRAHCEDGKLAYYSCCCLIGAPNADHALTGVGEYCGNQYEAPAHIVAARELPFARLAEDEFRLLGSDEERRAILLPLIFAEQESREDGDPGDETDEYSDRLEMEHSQHADLERYR
jgi:hypothetical protein